MQAVVPSLFLMIGIAIVISILIPHCLEWFQSYYIRQSNAEDTDSAIHKIQNGETP